MKNAPVRILMVEDNPGDARLLRELLREVAGSDFELRHVERMADALAALGHETFGAVLLDLTLPDSQGLDTFLTIHRMAPNVPVVLLTGLQDETLAIEAVSQGAQDYLVKGTVEGDELARSIRYAIARHARFAAGKPGRTRGRVISFVGAKGGVGTTTVALNITAALARRDKTVAAAEIRRCCGTFSAQLGRVPRENVSHVLRLEPDEIDAAQMDSRLVTFPFGAHILFGPQQPEEFIESTPEKVEAVVETLAKMFDFVILDLPCCPSTELRTAVEHSDFVCVVVEREPSAVAAAGVMVELLKSWGAAAQRLGAIVVNRSPTIISGSLRDMGGEIGCAIVGAVPHAAEQFTNAQRICTPLVVSEPGGMAATNLIDLAIRLSADTVTPIAF